MTDRFRTAPLGENPPLDLAGAIYLCSGGIGMLNCWVVAENRGFRNFGLCLRSGLQLRSFPKRPPQFNYKKLSFTPGPLFVVVKSMSLRRDLIALEPTDRLRYIPEFQTLGPTERPVAQLLLPAPDESSIGQSMQLSILAHEATAQLVAD